MKGANVALPTVPDAPEAHRHAADIPTGRQGAKVIGYGGVRERQGVFEAPSRLRQLQRARACPPKHPRCVVFGQRQNVAVRGKRRGEGPRRNDFAELPYVGNHAEGSRQARKLAALHDGAGGIPAFHQALATTNAPGWRTPISAVISARTYTPPRPKAGFA